MAHEEWTVRERDKKCVGKRRVSWAQNKKCKMCREQMTQPTAYAIVSRIVNRKKDKRRIAMKDKLIDLVGISKSFDEVMVLDDLNLYIRENEF
jgi:hypothetical protein